MKKAVGKVFLFNQRVETCFLNEITESNLFNDCGDGRNVSEQDVIRYI